MLEDAAELGDTYRHDKRVLRVMFKVMVWQQGFMAMTRQSRAVVFQWLNLEASTRHDEGQLCAGEHISGSESRQIMVFW